MGTLHRSIAPFLEAVAIIRFRELPSESQAALARDLERMIKALEYTGEHLGHVTSILRFHLPQVAQRGRN
jgi:hypothetical protein